MKYPDQIKAIIRQKNLIIDAFLSLPKDENEDPPLEMYSGFSRFLFTIRTTENGQNVFTKANVVVDDIADIKKRTDYALGLIFEAETVVAPKSESIPNSPAFTVRLIDRNYKNQTPAEVLMKNPEAKESLLTVKEWLTDHLKDYPRNAAQIEAIDDAINLVEKGLLQSGPISAQTVRSFKVYESETKYFTSERDKDKDGNHKIYNILILCEPGKNYPFTVNIMNCYAPLDYKPGGATQIRMSAAKGKTSVSISLTEKEWANIVERMRKTMDNFEATHASKQLALHKKFEWQPDSTKTA